MRQLVFLCFIFFLSFSSFGQTKRELEKLAHAQNDIIDLIEQYDKTASAGSGDIKFLKKALKLSQDIHYEEGIRRSAEKYSVELVTKGDFEEASRMVDISLQATDSTLYAKKYANLLNQKGHILQYQKKYNEAVSYYNRALIIYKKLGDNVEIANTHIDIGNTYYKSGNTDKSEEYLLLASKTFVQIKDTKNKKVAPALKHLGEVYDEQGNFKEALNLLSQSLTLYQSQNDQEGIASTLVSIGNIYYNLNQFDTAHQYFTDALNLAKKYNLKVSLLESYQGLSHIMSVKKDYGNAFDLYNKYMSVKDSIYEEAKNKSMQEVRGALELRIKNQQIDILNSRNEVAKLQAETQKYITYGLIIASILLIAITFLLIQRNRLRRKVNELLIKQNKDLVSVNSRLKQSEQELINLNLTKDKFFSIIAHDLRSPIASLIGFLNLLEDNSTSFSHSELLTFSKQMKESVHNLNDLMNNLLQWALTQSGAIECKPQTCVLNDMVKKNIELFQPFLTEKRITLDYFPIRTDEIIIDINMIDFVIRNLIQNAIKFTRPGGRIIIKQGYTNGQFQLSIEDNGIGIPEDHIPSLFRIDSKTKQVGTANEKGTGLGLILSREFMERNGGHISARSKKGEGTTFILTFQ